MRRNLAELPKSSTIRTDWSETGSIVCSQVPLNFQYYACNFEGLFFSFLIMRRLVAYRFPQKIANSKRDLCTFPKQNISNILRLNTSSSVYAHLKEDENLPVFSSQTTCQRHTAQFDLRSYLILSLQVVSAGYTRLFKLYWIQARNHCLQNRQTGRRRRSDERAIRLPSSQPFFLVLFSCV